MEILRIGALTPPSEQRSHWAREMLTEALALGLQPCAVPVQDITSFTATVSPAVASRLKALASEKDMPITRLTAGLIEALLAARQAPPSETAPKVADSSIIGTEHVRAELQPLLQTCVEGSSAGKIVFAEAATGAGKGRMIAAIAATAVARGDTVVISAPLAVTWQLVTDLDRLPAAKAAGITMSLGRPNFVSPERLLDWAKESDHQELTNWIEGGGRPITAKTAEASLVIDQDLAWMLEDALALAEDLPIDAIMLRPDDPEDCPAQKLYKSMRSNHSGAAIILCSHYMLASQVRLMQLRGANEEGEELSNLLLPQVIDTLIVDEAHQLEQAFAAIYSHTLRLRPLIREIEQLGGRDKAPAVAALKTLSNQITRESDRAKGGIVIACQLDDVPEIEAALREALAALEKVKLRGADASSATIIRLALLAMKDALSGHSRLRVELSPVRRYPSLISGKANLRSALERLWDTCAGAALVSATLYAGDEKNMLTRWKLEVPPQRAVYAPPVHPAWTISPVTLHPETGTIEPNDSEEWIAETAQLVLGATQEARGGSLVLCTSHENAEALHERLREALGDRLILQTRRISASMCSAQFQAMHKNGGRPVWLGLGAAWTGINLSDSEVAAETDSMLTNLVITRLPIGLNRSLTHERRVSIAGFKVVTLEAIWQLRQGLGRLIRRPGVQDRHLWVLDARLAGTAPWVTPYKRLLSRYRSTGMG